ncbi:glycosyltransferase [Clostridium sp. YIM B02551]|uniref:glycosyltransferase n=1 Tax=Clostridium sp. YIM B02551 TaxID=2910679 RepID=UPI001EEBBD61|nr:glycosyltransferase [Clostridium sp. YIM B02551]
MIKVSVLMITYNHEKYIENALNSIFMQKVNFNFEIVIGEDCSQDSTREILEKYAKLYPDKVKLNLPNKNLGPINNFISTLKQCTGEYIAFLEGDDYWLDENKLQKQVDFLDDNKDTVMCFGKAKNLVDGILEDESFPNLKNHEPIGIEQLIEYNLIPNLTTMWRREAMIDFPKWFYNIYAIGDFPMHILRAMKGKIIFLDEVFGAYRIHSLGVSKSMKDKWFNELIFILENINIETNYKYDNLIRNKIIQYNYELCKIYSLDKEYEKAKKCLEKVKGEKCSIKLKNKIIIYFIYYFKDLGVWIYKKLKRM